MDKANRQIAGSLNALMVFEAAVRHRSFSGAAAELNLSQPAVSRHVSTLELRLGQPLFIRNNNRIVPTGNAQRLADAVALGFGHVRDTWNSISAPTDRDEVVLACSFGIADQWLMPRFSDLRASMRGARVSVVTTDQLEDIDLSSIDAAVVWQPEAHPERPAIPLIPDECFPVCTPDFYAQHVQGNDDLSDVPPDLFLHLDVGRSGFLTWKDWFTKAGCKPVLFGNPIEFDAYPFLIQAVLSGEGLALGWRGLVDRLLAEGHLMRAGRSVSKHETAYFLQHRPIMEENTPLARLVNWFRGKA